MQIQQKKYERGGFIYRQKYINWQTLKKQHTIINVNIVSQEQVRDMI